jgi:hypothetical protein
MRLMGKSKSKPTARLEVIQANIKRTRYGVITLDLRIQFLKELMRDIKTGKIDPLSISPDGIVPEELGMMDRDGEVTSLDRFEQELAVAERQHRYYVEELKFYKNQRDEYKKNEIERDVIENQDMIKQATPDAISIVE